MAYGTGLMYEVRQKCILKSDPVTHETGAAPFSIFLPQYLLSCLKIFVWKILCRLYNWEHHQRDQAAKPQKNLMNWGTVADTVEESLPSATMLQTGFTSPQIKISQSNYNVIHMRLMFNSPLHFLPFLY